MGGEWTEVKTPEQNQLDRIEEKLDRLVSVVDDNTIPAEVITEWRHWGVYPSLYQLNGGPCPYMLEARPVVTNGGGYLEIELKHPNGSHIRKWRMTGDNGPGPS
jgi:hypothetical protein